MALGASTFFQLLPPAFGLDISDTSLKFVQFKKNGSSFKLKTYGERDLKPGVVQGGNIIKPQELAVIIREALSKEHLPPYVIASLPGEAIFLTMIQLPPGTDEELRGQVQVEAEAHIPIDLADAYWDYHVLPVKGQDTNYVLVSAARKSTVESYLGVFEKAGLNVIALEPESSAIARSVISGNRAEKPILIIEIGANRTRFIIFLADSAALVGSASFSSTIGAEALARKLKIDIADAHRLQWETGLKEDKKYDTKVQESLTPLVDGFVRSVDRYVAFFNGRRLKGDFPFPDIGSVLLSGGGSRMPGLDKYLSSALGLPVSRANPWINVEPSSKKYEPPLRPEQSLRYTTALGLALRAAEHNVESVLQ